MFFSLEVAFLNLFFFSFHSIFGMTETFWKVCNLTEQFKRIHCADGHVPAPLPFDCPGLNISANCLQITSSILSESKGMIIAGYEQIPWTKNDCLERTLMSLSSPLRIEMDKIEKIYGVFIRSEYRVSSVKVLRNTSNTHSNASQCSYINGNIQTGFDEFYCFTGGYPIKSDEQIGFSANMIEIHGNLPVDPCVFLKETKVYPYPVFLCRSPGLYKECQTIVPNTNYYLTGETISYKSMDENMQLMGDSVRKCQPGGSWSGKPPVCATKIQRKFYPQSYCDVPCNAKLSYQNQHIRVNRHGTYFIFENTFSIVYIEIKSYEQDKIEVFTPTTNNFFQWKFLNTTEPSGQWSYKTRTSWYISNDEQYIFTRTSKVLVRVTSGQGTIFELVVHGTSVIDNCPSIDLIPNAKWLPYYYGDSRGQWSCELGYEASSNILMICKEGLWTGTPPHCKRKQCLMPPQLENADWEYESPNYHDRVIYECQYGYARHNLIENHHWNNQNSETAECKSNEWENINFSCIATNCSAPPEILNATYFVEGDGIKQNQNKDKKLHHHGTILRYNCDHGYFIDGSNTIYCNNTQWSFTVLPKCQVVRCNFSKIILKNASTEASQIEDEPHYGTVINFTCSEGMFIEGEKNQTSTTVQCQSDGEWNRLRIACIRVSPLWTLGVGVLIGGSLGVIALLTVLNIFLNKRSKTTNHEAKAPGDERVVMYENLKHLQKVGQYPTGEPIYHEAINPSQLNSNDSEILYCELGFNHHRSNKPVNKIPDEDCTQYATIMPSSIQQ